MPSSPAAKVVEHLRKAMLRQEEDQLSDGQLLDRYLEKRDDAAFAALVRRHGSMVWGVCRRIVGHVDDAEDAFQAAFLILVRKAAAVKPRDAVGNWLYGVACHASYKARTAAARLRAKEKQVASMPEPVEDRRNDRDELYRLLDQELSALPDKYRLPVVLCDLEGRTRKAVAAQLKIPEGTLSSRLATAHQMLAKRLARHGLAVSATSLAALFAHAADAPAAVVVSTIQTATLVAASNGAVAGVASTKVAALTEGVMKAMLLSKLKSATAALLLLGVIAAGATFLGGPTQPAVLSQVPNKRAQAGVASAVKPREETAELMRLRAETTEFMRLLDLQIETKGLHEKVKLRTALQFFSDKFGGKLRILVDRDAFVAELGDEAQDPYEAEVCLPAEPSKMTMELALRMTIAQIGEGRATFVIHRGWIEITTHGASKTANPLRRPSIVGSFHQRQLVEVLQELSDKAGVTINIDPHASSATPISATFRNCSLEEALVTVTEMCQLKFVVFDHSVFVTTPERAKTIEQEEAARQKKRTQNTKKDPT